MKLVFESTYHTVSGIEDLYLIHIFLLLVILLLGFIFRKKVFEYKGMIIFFVICLFFYYLGLESKIKLSQKIDNALKYDKYLVAEGVIENFIPMPLSGHVREIFNVKDIEFTTLSLENNKNTMFFNMTKYYGSPIQKMGRK
jgi:hypothetical protein